MSPLIAAHNRAKNHLDTLQRLRSVGTNLQAQARTPDQRSASLLFAETINASIFEMVEIVRLLDQAKALSDFHEAARAQ